MNENTQNARLIKEAREKKEQANKFANKGGVMRKQAQKLKEEAEKLQASVVDVRKEDKSLKPFEIPLQDIFEGKGNAKLLDLGCARDPRKEGKIKMFKSGGVTVMKGTHIRIVGPNGIGKYPLFYINWLNLNKNIKY